jgi:hypothetical protein
VSKLTRIERKPKVCRYPRDNQEEQERQRELDKSLA